MWYIYTFVAVFIVTFITYCILIKEQIKFPFMPYDFDEFLAGIGIVFTISALWIVVFPIAILFGILYLVYVFLTD